MQLGVAEVGVVIVPARGRRAGARPRGAGGRPSDDPWRAV